jgi:hypothetical protein
MKSNRLKRMERWPNHLTLPMLIGAINNGLNVNDGVMFNDPTIEAYCNADLAKGPIYDEADRK